MIINEGFLSNAKKIASQPQNSEANVPVIKRENYEYNVNIKIKSNIEITYFDKIKKIILSNEIFKEYGNVKEDSFQQKRFFRYLISFDSDFYISIDSVYYFILSIIKYPLEFKISITDENKKGPIVFYLNKDIFYFDIENKIIQKDNILSLYYYKKNLNEFKSIFECFGINERLFYRWMIRNDISVMILGNSSDEHEENFITLPVYIKSRDVLHEFGRRTCISLKDINEDMLLISSNEGLDEFIDSINVAYQYEYLFYYDLYYNINIQSLYPVIYNGKYMYFWFEIKDTSDIYEYIKRIISNNKACTFEFDEKHRISDLKFVDYESEMKKSVRKGIKRYSIYININGEEYVDASDYINDIIKVIKNKNIFKDTEDIGIDSITYGNKKYKRISLNTDINFSIDNIYDFIHLFYNDEYYMHIILIDNKNGKSISIRNPDRLCEIKKGYLYDYDDSNFIYFKEIIKKFGFSDNDITEWYVKNNINILSNCTDGETAVYIDSPIDLIKKLDSVYMRSTNFKYVDCSESPEKMVKILNDLNIHEYMISMDLYFKNLIKITLSPLYPIKYGNEYVYIYFITEYEKTNDIELYNYFEKLNTKLKKYSVKDNAHKTSELTFVKIDGNGNLKIK